MKTHLLLTILTTVSLAAMGSLAACSSDDDPPPNNPPADGGLDSNTADTATGAATLDQVYAIFEAKCNGCHSPQDGGSPRGNLGLKNRATLHANLVGVAAKGAACSTAGDIRVVAGDPDESLLLNKVKGTAGTCGARMPLPADKAPLSDAEIAIIESWIEDGAKP